MSRDIVVELATRSQLAVLATRAEGRAQIRRCIDALHIEKRQQVGRRHEANAARDDAVASIKRIEHKLADLVEALGPDGGE